jgi:tRNA(Leu) C34 or U34 (ribose-2'-O)-methylase TrmL
MFGVALLDPKNAWNVGNALRSTVAFGGSLFVIKGNRYTRTGEWERSDTESARDRIPVFTTLTDPSIYFPTNALIVGVEMVKDATSIIKFEHPTNAVYLFGPEDGRIDDDTLAKCDYKIYLPTAYSLNLAACVACIGHDRMLKADRESRQVCPTCGKSHIKWLENVEKWHCNACGHEWSVS